MREQQFYHDVVGPYVRLISRAAECVCVSPDFNDVISLAKHSATATYHFHEVVSRTSAAAKIPKLDAPFEVLRDICGCVADTAKHGELRDPDRMVEFNATAAFEFNSANQFRFIRTEVIGVCARHGEFEVADTVLALMNALRNHHEINLELEFRLPSHPFKERVELFLTEKSGFDIRKTRLSFYRRDDFGQLVRADPEIVDLVVVE